MKFLENFKEELKKQNAEQQRLAQTPDAPEAKKRARLGGAVMTVLGFAFALGNYLSWTQTGVVPVITLVLMLVFLVFGPYVLATGRMPKKK